MEAVEEASSARKKNRNLIKKILGRGETAFFKKQGRETFNFFYPHHAKKKGNFFFSGFRILARIPQDLF